MNGFWLAGYELYWNCESSEFSQLTDPNMRAGWITAATEVMMGVYVEFTHHTTLGCHPYGPLPTP